MVWAAGSLSSVQGIFATSLAQSNALDLPIRNLLVSKFVSLPLTQENPCREATGSLHMVSEFFAIVTLPWYLKFIFGIFCDRVPLFGTMRRNYVILSATAATVLWMAAGMIQYSYLSLAVTLTAMECMLVICSTVIGALLVEAGQGLDAAGSLVSARMFIEGLCVVVAGPLAGVLAGIPFEGAAIVGGIIAFSIVPVAFIWLKEQATASYQISAVVDVKDELVRIFRSGKLWLAAGFIFLASIPQLFPTPLWNLQKCQMGLSDLDIGYLRTAGGVGGMLAALLYAVIYRRYKLKTLIVLGIIGSAVGSISYLFYSTPSAVEVETARGILGAVLALPASFAVETANGMLSTLWVLAMMEMAVWTAPRTAEAAAFALLMGAYNLGNSVGDYLFSELMDRGILAFSGVAELSAVCTALTLIFFHFLPDRLFGRQGR